MSATQAIVTDNRSKRQVERDTRRNEATAQKRLTSRGATIAAVIIAIFWTIPTLGLFVTSFRPGADSNSTGWWTVFVDPSFTLSNYADALTSGGTALTLGASFVNSLAITIPATVIPIFIASLAAYGFAWMNFKGKNLVFVFVFALQIVPIQMALVPLLSLFSRGLTLFGTQIFPGFTLRDVDHSFATVWIAHAIFAMPLAIFMLHNFIAEIPGEVVEAARVDGAGHGQIFFRIILPLAMPAIASFAIFQFLWVWNDLLVATIFAPESSLPLTQTLNSLSGTWGNQWYLQSAGTFISIIVPLIVFFALQRFFVRGLLAGATKG
ncbi:carbohydrate ABC transporter permease [Microbacterium azadirachtae]|uniref:L-arabinose transport system permease protein AraQ n=1 Tax=Microbacterium azadirachtae TaxID=582680 RepID=A0A0F0KUW6_9MICO|nr:carbohydrate ABC transporter permease [Microbacterium azadirachtae]KJL23905.1 L-arabinose transport system permease protein AraQ [Microbacterium azadirachtae]UXW85148.1 carbohydrate ABC transporter permease [Microbacterium azadirachtae]SDM08533.1 carbohydrate ABC transporter membrane protein 2, CUT1 family [Microbacterium azadirachtae]SEG33643.1 carbohydrate ABC transporter membrane protein 2, CUT1 family [Microbacterium azadirachtae]SEG36548.1 carbohydrate ABC transporter membrane protein 